MVVSKTRETVSPNHDEVEAKEIEYYYDSHPTREDLMGDSVPQFNLIIELVNLLRWLYRAENWFIIGDLNIYQTGYYKESPVTPDVAIFKGVTLTEAERKRLKSWKMKQHSAATPRPTPSVVFEIASEETWQTDLELKPIRYLHLGVKEYFAYDPNTPQYWKDKPIRLKGWRYQDDEIEEIKANSKGWLWSEELQSWLVPESESLRFYDRDEKRRLSEVEEVRRNETAEKAAKEQERLAKETAWAKLRELGIDPEKL